MSSIDSSLVLQLWEVFPESFSIAKTSPVYETYNGRFGTEDVQTGTETETLASCILNTANAIHIKYGAKRSTAYINEFITKRVADKAKEIFPGYHAYLDKTYLLPQLALHSSFMSYGETFYIRLCGNGGKRIDAEIVKAEADKRESEAVQLEKQLESFYEMVSRYNGLVAEYSTIRDSLYSFFPDIPYVWRRDA